MSIKTRALRGLVRARKFNSSPNVKLAKRVGAHLGLAGLTGLTAGASYGIGRAFGRRRAKRGKTNPSRGGQIALGLLANPFVALGRRHGYNKAKYGVARTANVPKSQRRRKAR